MNDVTYIGKTNWRNSDQHFGIRDKDRLSHIYAIGKSGTGKSTLLLNMAISDIERGNGICVLDPHADLVQTLLNFIPKSRISDVIYFNAADTEYSIAFNPLHDIEPSAYNIVCSSLISTCKKIWAESWGPRLEHILRFSILSLLHYHKSTLLDVSRLLTDAYFRNHVLLHVTDTAVREFWKNEFDKYTPQLRAEAISPILNKIGLLIASEPLRYILGQHESSFSMEEVMNSRKILICNLAKGVIGEEASSFLGSMILSAIQTAALGRAFSDSNKRVPYYVYADESQSFLTMAVCDILAECRKYGLSLFLANQYIEQLHEKVRTAIFGNVGTLISFRVGAVDAKYMAEEFFPTFKQDDFVNLPKYAMYLKLMIDGGTSRPFSAVSLPLADNKHGNREIIIHESRERYGKHINEIRQQIEDQFRPSIETDRNLFSGM